jgi:hypothetical protein
MFYKNNWLTWYYDGIERGIKRTPSSKYELKIIPTIKHSVKSYKEELLANTSLIRDSFSEPFDLLFSGGGDSEVVLRCNLELGIPINVFIFRYENNYNLPDVTHALRICNELNVTPTIIDFNLHKFFENDAYDIWKKSYANAPGRLPHLKMLDYLDNIPIMGDGDPVYVYDTQWLYQLNEIDHSTTCYANTIGRTMIADWYEYSPEVLISYLQTPLMQQLVNGVYNNYYNNKYCVYKSIWQDIWIRQKLVGFEGYDIVGNPVEVPKFMMDFKRQFIDPVRPQKNMYRFTPDELISCLYLPT